MQDAHFEFPQTLSADHLKMLHLSPQPAIGYRPPAISHQQSAREAV